MSFVAPTFKTLDDGVTSPITQKVSAFRPGSLAPGEIYTSVVDRDVNDLCNRYFFKCVDNASFQQLIPPAGNWLPTPYDRGSQEERTSVSLVIDPNGIYLHAVTTVDQLVVGAGYVHYLFYGRLNLDDPTSGWDDTVLDTYSDSTPAGYLNPDIIIDRRTVGDKKPIIVSEKANPAGYQSWIFWYGSDPTTLNIRRISGDVIPNGKTNIVSDPNSNYYYINAKLDTSSYLYRLWFDENGIAYVPDENGWQSTVESEAPVAQMITGSGDVGFVWAPFTGGVNFRLFQNNAMTDIETINSVAIDTNSMGLCFRGGQWHLVYTIAPDDTIHWLWKDIESGDWVEDDLGNAQIGESDWSYFGITGEEINPNPREPNEFGCFLTENIGVGLNECRYFHVDTFEPQLPTPPTNNHWTHGDLLTSDVFAVNLDTDAIGLIKGNKNLKIMDTVKVEDAIIHTDQDEFYEWKKDFFKDWRDNRTYDNIGYFITLPAEDGGNDNLKLCQGALIEWDAVGLTTIYLTITNEENNMFIRELTNADNGKPVNFSFGGRYFKPTLFETSQIKFNVRKYATWGQDLGSRV